MSNKFMISLVGANRIGVLAAVTTALDELGGNLQEMSTTVVKTAFSMIAFVEFPEHRKQDVVIDHIRDVCRPYQIEVSLQQYIPYNSGVAELTASPGTLTHYTVTASGKDEAGVLRTVALRLSQEQVDVRNVYSRSDEVGHAFIMELQVAVPANVDFPALCKDLEELGEFANLSIELELGRDRESELSQDISQ